MMDPIESRGQLERAGSQPPQTQSRGQNTLQAPRAHSNHERQQGRPDRSTTPRNGLLARSAEQHVQYSAAICEWLDFLAGLLANVARAERGGANASEDGPNV